MLNFFKFFLFFCLPTLVLALPEDKRQLAQLQADQVDFDTQKHQGSYRGHVVFVQGSSHLEADEAQTLFKADNQIKYAKALSLKGPTTHFWTQVNAKDPEFHAYARQIEYFPDKHLIILKGEATIQQGENKMYSPIIEYNLETQHLVTKAEGAQRTRLVIKQDKKI